MSNVISSLREFDALVNEENLFDYRYMLFGHIRVPIDGMWLDIEDCSECHWKMLEDLGMPTGEPKYKWFSDVFKVPCTVGRFPEANSREDFIKVIRKLFEIDEKEKGFFHTIKSENTEKTKKTRDGIIIINKQKSFKIKL